MSTSIDFQQLLAIERKKFLSKSNLESTINKISSDKQNIDSNDNVIFRNKIILHDINLLTAKVGSLDCIYYINEVITRESEQMILDRVHSYTWEALRTRRLQCYDSTKVMPAWLHQIIDELRPLNIFDEDTTPNHVLINEYQPSQGIMHHTDGPSYSPYAIILSLESSCIMTFRKKLLAHEIGLIENKDLLQVVLQPRSLLVFTDDAYINYMHGINADEEVQVVGVDDIQVLNLDKSNTRMNEVVRLVISLLILF